MNSYFEQTELDPILNLIAMLFLIVTSLLFLLNKEFRTSKSLFLISLTAIIMRILLIIFNVNISTLPGSDKDAIGFVRAARRMNENEIMPENFVGSDLFEYIISLVFKYSLDNVLFLISLNNIVFLIAILLVLRTLTVLKISEKYRIFAIVILFLYPSLLFNSITVLREPLQFLLLTIGVYLYVTILKYGFSLPKFILIFISIFLFGMLHNGLLALIPIITMLFSIGLYKNTKSNQVKILIVFSNILFITLTVLSFITGLVSSPLVDSILQGGGSEYTEEYREGAPDTRASYGGEFSFSNPIIAIYSSISVFIKYFIYPLPWQMSSVQDLVPLFENILRLGFLYYTFKNFRILNKMKYLLFIFFVIEFVWALGTSNWGTASRHHIIQSQILVIIFVYLKETMNVIKIKGEGR